MTNSAARADDGPRNPARRWFFYGALLCVVVGAILVAVGAFMPAYTDPVSVQRIISGAECELGVPNKDKNSRCDTEVWHRSMDGLRTYKWPLVDAGAGLLASALSIFVFAKWGMRKSCKDMATPKRSLTIVGLAALIWLMQIPAYVLFFVVEVSTRDCCPWWADSMMIPLVQILAVVLVLLLPFLAVWLVFVVGARLPVALFCTVPGRPIVNALWTAAAAVLGAFIVLYLVGVILYGPVLMVPFLWLALWLALCARAAALSRHLPGPEASQA